MKARIVTLPSVDSRVTSVNQPLTPTSSSVLAIIDIVAIIIFVAAETTVLCRSVKILSNRASLVYDIGTTYGKVQYGY